MRIAISTGGGDAPGLNAVSRAAVLSALNRGWDVLGIKRGFAGLMGEDEVIPLTRELLSFRRPAPRADAPAAAPPG